MRKLIPILLLNALLLTACAVPAEEASPVSYLQIDAYEAASMMEKEENYIILDVRTFEEFEAAHIPGAICIPNESISDQPVEQLPDKDQLILVYCRSGNRINSQEAETLMFPPLVCLLWLSSLRFLRVSIRAGSSYTAKKPYFRMHRFG